MASLPDCTCDASKDPLAGSVTVLLPEGWERLTPEHREFYTTVWCSHCKKVLKSPAR